MSVEQDVERLVKACRTAIRQYDGNHPIGHDAILELHRSLKKCVPELQRKGMVEIDSGAAAPLDELGAIEALKALAKKWPKSLWLFSANGALCVMRKNAGQRAVLDRGGYNSNFVLDIIEGIENDGGDW
jgi:hypothetical protein